MAENDLEGNHLPKINSEMKQPGNYINILQPRSADPQAAGLGLSRLLLLTVAPDQEHYSAHPPPNGESALLPSLPETLRGRRRWRYKRLWTQRPPPCPTPAPCTTSSLPKAGRALPHLPVRDALRNVDHCAVK